VDGLFGNRNGPDKTFYSRLVNGEPISPNHQRLSHLATIAATKAQRSSWLPKGRMQMFFTKAARIIAIVAIVLGLLRVLVGNYVAFHKPEGRDLVQSRYLGSSTSGQAIDQGIYIILFAMALGTLAEISFQIKRVHDKL
jgi:hypothetical protein